MFKLFIYKLRNILKKAVIWTEDIKLFNLLT